jgi:sodium-dependent phosphate cotransporter
MATVEDPTKSETPGGASRKERPTGSTHFGDTDFAEEEVQEIGDASWGEVATACCVHDAAGWGKIFIGACGALFFLYFFLFSLELLGNAAKVLGGCSAGGLLSDETNPVASLVIGELATALVQSSSTTTSIVVTLVGAEAVSVKSGIYLIMGANIGTSVTNTIIAMGQMGSGDQLERAFAGATVHDLFNLLSVAVLFPLELITHYLYHLTSAMLPDTVSKGDKWNGPLKAIVSPLASRVLKANKDVIKEVATEKVESCDAYYPVTCIDGIEDYKHCASKCDKDAGESFENGDCGRVGLITCDKKTGCPAFFQHGASKQDDATSGGVCLFLSLVLLLVCLMGLVNVLQRGLMGMSTRVIYKATKVPGIFAIVIGAAITVMVQSSSITTSVLTPIVGLGVIQLEQMLPLTLGANIGTTITGLLAALVSGKVEALQVALAHLFFNITGILIWYPIPFMRKVPLEGARALGKWTRRSRAIPPIYIVIVFFVIPIGLLLLSSLFQIGSVGFTVLGVFLVIFVVAGILKFVWYWKKQEGRAKFLAWLDKRQIMNDCKATLPEDMQFLKSKVEQLVEHTGLPEDEETDDIELKPIDEEEPKELSDATGSEEEVAVAVPASADE